MAAAVAAAVTVAKNAAILSRPLSFVARKLCQGFSASKPSTQLPIHC